MTCLASKKKKITVIALIVTTCVFVLPAFASLGTAIMSVANNWIETMLTESLENPVLDYFTTPFYLNDNFSAAVTLVNNVLENVVEPLSLGLVGIAFMIKVLEMTMDLQHVTPERFFTPFLTLVVVSFFIINVGDILTLIIDIGARFASNVNDQVIETVGSYDMEALTSSLLPGWEDGDSTWIQALLIIIELILPYGIWNIINLLVKVVAWGVILELVVRCVTIPICAPEIMLNGLSGRAMQLIKGLFACACTGAMIIIILGLQESLMYSILSAQVAECEAAGTLGSTAAVISSVGLINVIEFACLAILMKAGQMMREALGA